MQAPFSVYDNLEAIFKIFARVENCIEYYTEKDEESVHDKSELAAINKRVSQLNEIN